MNLEGISVMVGTKQLEVTNGSYSTETDFTALRFVCLVLIPAGFVVKIFSLHDCNDPGQPHRLLSSAECHKEALFLCSTFSVTIRITSAFILSLFITNAFL